MKQLMSVNKGIPQIAYLQEVLYNLIRDDVAHIVCIGEFGKGNSSHFGLLQVCKSWPSTVACIPATLVLSIGHSVS